ncbi:MAG: flagellar basal body rod protein FlgC [Lachnospiraceae bacterium]|nr:flagellar basal body rod protein FlgC [Lachnospiraceae bacterium]
MSLFSSFDINASGLTAERYRMDIISQNIANANTTRTEDGTPYRRKVVTFAEKETQTPFSRVLNEARDNYSGKGVKVSTVEEDTWTDMKMVYDPAHPDADENGYVLYPNVNIVTEMTNMIDASRAYEANATAFNASKAIALKGLEMAQ